MKVSLISTVLNEEESIKNFLDSISIQTKKPDEVIIVDGGSIDGTIEQIIKFQKLHKRTLKIKLLTAVGNRSIGRNCAIKNTTGDIIVCSDAGCRLDKNWIKNIVKPFEKVETDVVAGYYKGVSENIFQKSLIPYALVMPDKVDPTDFLPATRSMAFRKDVWEKVGGFDEKLSHNEDYAFARKLRDKKFNILFEKSAIVYWYPPKSFEKSFVMFYRFAYGDAEAKIFRAKALLVFLRYAIGVLLLLLAIIKLSMPLLLFLIVGLTIYIVWSIQKNYRYVSDERALILLPSLQFLSDFAVLTGTMLGLIKYGI